MEFVKTPPSDCEQRAIVKFLTAENVSGKEIHDRMCLIYGPTNVMNVRAVYKWIKRFREDGRTSTHDEPRSGRPSDSLNEDTIACVRTLLDEDRRYTVSDIQSQMAERFLNVTSRTTIHRALTEVLEMSKVSARWVPRELSDEHRKNRMGAALELLTRYNEQGDDFLNRIVTGDESWIHFWTPETKQASMVWKTKDEPAPKKFKQQASAGKVMLTAFWDSTGIIYTEYLPHGSTINSGSYFDTLIRLKMAIKSKRPGLLSRKVVLLHDNARPHSALLNQKLLADFQWEIFPHPPYSPDLAPSDYHLFPTLKRQLQGKRFQNLEELKAAIGGVFQNLDGKSYSDGIQKLVYRYNKCLDSNGDYVEK